MEGSKWREQSGGKLKSLGEQEGLRQDLKAGRLSYARRRISKPRSNSREAVESKKRNSKELRRGAPKSMTGQAEMEKIRQVGGVRLLGSLGEENSSCMYGVNFGT